MTTWLGQEIQAELRDGHREIVTRGMETLSWQYAAAWWAAVVATEEARVDRQRKRSVAALSGGLVGSIATAVAMVESILPTLGLVGAMTLLAPTVVVGFMLANRHEARLKALRREKGDPPAVTFTSTGVLAGDLARPWKGDSCRLADLYIVAGVLRLDVVTGLFSDTIDRLDIPIPPELQEDVRDLATRLAERLGARFGGLPTEVGAAKQVGFRTRR
jgi:hypothetical protein